MDVIDRLIAKVPHAKLSLNSAIELSELEQFENEAGVRIPDDYREFLLRIANGGHSHCRLVSLSDWCASYWGDDAKPSFVAEPCIVTPDVHEYGKEWLDRSGVVDWNARWDRNEWNPMFGTIAVAEIGCGLFFSMVMNGPFRGRIFSWGDHALNPPYMYPHNNFGEWFESWIDMILEGQPVHFLDGRIR